jgi:hypothetical protein
MLLNIDSPLVTQFEALSAASTLKPAELAQLHYTLAHLHRRKGSAAMSIRHLFEANAQQRTNRADAHAQYEEMFDRLEGVFTRSLFENLERADPIEPTPLFVLGMPRSGTTLVERLLAAHPNVSAGGELDYMRRRLRRSVERATGRIFPEGIDTLDAAQLNAMAGAFAQRLHLIAPGSTHVTDKTPGNYHLLGLLRVLFPLGRIVHVQRDPMDTCFSILQYPFDDRSPHTSDIPLLAYSYSRYVRLMRKWEELFAGEFFTVRYEELVSNPLTIGRGLYEHTVSERGRSTRRRSNRCDQRWNGSARRSGESPLPSAQLGGIPRFQTLRALAERIRGMPTIHVPPGFSILPLRPLREYSGPCFVLSYFFFLLSARNSHVSITVSGFRDMLSMPCSTSQRARSG